MSSFSRATAGWISALLVLLLSITYVLSLGVGLALVAVGQFANELSSTARRLPIGVSYFYPIAVTPFAIRLSLLVYSCISVFVVCFLAGLRSREGFLRGLSKLANDGRITRSSNWLVAMPLISSGLIIGVLVITLILSLSGVSQGSLCDPMINKCPSQAILFAGLAYAPIGEEVAFRILTPLGLVVPCRILWRRLITNPATLQGRFPHLFAKFLGIVALSLLSPEWAKHRTGYPTVLVNGWGGIHWLEWIVIVFSSTLFGIAHLQPGSGTNWETGKAVTAALAGLVIATCYVAYGAYAAVLLHWFFDFYPASLTLGFPTSGGVLALLVNGVVSFSIIITGSLALIVATVWLAKRISARIAPTTYKPPESIPDPIE